jgi:hypothetical protein
MSLDSNVSDLATRIGQEIKDVRADMALISGGGGVLTATALLDFGTSGTKYKLFTINDANITLGKKVGGLIYKPTNIKVSTFIKESIDDDEFDSIEFSIRDFSVGSFQILAKSNGIINNYKTIQYTIQ